MRQGICVVKLLLRGRCNDVGKQVPEHRRCYQNMVKKQSEYDPSEVFGDVLAVVVEDSEAGWVVEVIPVDTDIRLDAHLLRVGEAVDAVLDGS